MAGDLLVLLSGAVVGTLRQDARGDLSFAYEPAWRGGSGAYPLSLSLPLSSGEHGDDAVRPFLEGLLPDHPGVLDQWARRFHVSARNPFALLAHMGEDCAGAVQVVRPERVEPLRDPAAGAVRWLSDDDVAQRVTDLVEHHGTGRVPGDRGYFSLAGAQPKTVLFRDGDRWGVPSGALPSTHILKPPVVGLDGFAANEHLCLETARELGMAVARSEVRTFGGPAAVVVVERYDRRRVDGRVARLHQEDFCQALAVPPVRKYEPDGGPGAPACLRLLLERSSDPGADAAAFLDALALNWALAGTDAHAKNFSLLLGPGSVRLAPLYDLVSALPYPRWIHPRQAKLAMRVGREYRVWKVGRRHWEEMAARAGLDPAPVAERVAAVLAEVPDAVRRAAGRVRADGLDDPVMAAMEAAITQNAAACLRRMER